MKSTTTRLAKVPLNACMAHNKGIAGKSSPAKDTPMWYSVIKNQNNSKLWRLPKLLAAVMLLVLQFGIPDDASAQTPPGPFTITVTGCTNTIATEAQGPQVLSFLNSFGGYDYFRNSYFSLAHNLSTNIWTLDYPNGDAQWILNSQGTTLPPCSGTLNGINCPGATYTFQNSCALPIFNVTTFKQDATCSSAINGWAKASPSGTCGTGYQYLWTPGNYTTDSIGGLATGTYNVRVVCGTDTVNKTVVIGAGTGPVAPTTSNQTLCAGATVNDLTATGTAIQWYATPAEGSPLPNSTLLVNGTNYYATQTAGGCESSTRAVNTVTVGGVLNPKADTAFCNSNASVSISLSGSAGNSYSWTATQNGTGIAASGTLPFITFTANNTSNAVKKDTVFVSSSYTSPMSYGLKDSTYYFADTTGSSYLTLPPNAPFANGDFPYGYNIGDAAGTMTDSIAIGFPFNFYGNISNKLFISRVGAITFKRGGMTINPAAPSEVISGYVAGWTFDAMSKIAYKVAGTAPNRSFIVTYVNLKKPADIAGTTYYTYTSNPVAGRGTFQIVLYETSNTIHSLKQLIPAVNVSINGGTPSPYSPVLESVSRRDITFSGTTYVPGRQGGTISPWLNINNENKIFFPVPASPCPTQRDTFFVSVLPTPKVDSIGNQQVCPGSTTAAINFTTPITGGTVGYKWSNSNTAIGLAANGFDNIPGFTAAATAQTSTITVSPYMVRSAGDTCFGANRSFTITADLPALPLANNSLIIYTGSKTLSQLAVPGTALQYYAAATGGIALAGTTTVQDDSTYYVTQTANGCESNRAKILVNRIANDSSVHCAGDSIANITTTPDTDNTVKWYDSPESSTVLTGSTLLFAGQDTLYVEETGSNRVPVITIVNPTPNVTANANQVVCNNGTVAAVNFSTTTVGGTVTYAWTNNKPAIGLAASGTGNIASFTGVNSGTAPDTATIIATPSITNGGVTCTGTVSTFTITINPTSKVNTVSNQTVCAGSVNSSVIFSSPVAGTSYNWTNSNPSIGLAASGTGNVPSFTAVNPAPNAITANITVTPITVAGCTGQPVTYTITVNGWSVAPSSINNPTPIVCANDPVASLAVNGGAPGSGATWKWYADSLAGASIGNGPTLLNITVPKNTTYYVRAEGTCNTTAAASVLVQKADLVFQVRQHWGDVLLFDNSSKNYVAWQWYKNGQAITGATMQQYSENTELLGSYYVVATDKNGVQSMTCPVTITAGSFKGLSISLYPNPADKGVNVKVSASFTATELQGATIIITDIYGRIVKQLNQVLPVSSIQAPSATGMYVVTLTLQNGKKYSANLFTK